ncbi:hypothetical protein BKA70DRAFT_1218657 [Coprinopsis sp. MPI-PUGE-AT-0042]|nr:hypothetical protein BKA70DRAFT_1218657 [Coprinopsis sp. MPI-PUGE-AT-0042]
MYKSQKSLRHFQQADSWAQEEDQELVAQLNDLMEGLHLPISIIAPTDLTPSLLIAILESLLGEKIPIPHRPSMGRTNSLQKVKVFLGVLETDVIQQPVGLSDIDPRRLADGGCEEVLFVAEVLVWIGRHVGLLPRASSSTRNPKQAARTKPSPTPSEGTSSANSTVRLNRTVSGRFSSPELDTTSVFYAPTTLEFEETSTGIPDGQPPSSPCRDETPSSVALSLKPPFESPSIHGDMQLGDSSPHIYEPLRGNSSLLFSADTNIRANPQDQSNDLSFLRGSTQESFDYGSDPIPVRYEGYIEPVDEEFEIASYLEQSQVLSPSASSASGSILGSLSCGDTDEDVKTHAILAIEEQYHRTLKLLDERARLLRELEEIDAQNG